METSDVIENMKNLNHQIISDMKKGGDKQEEVLQEETAQPVDIYQRDMVKIRENSRKSFPRGSSPIVQMAVYSVLDGAGGEGLARAYKRARDDSDSLKKRGERERADLVRKQYMNEKFLPAVELVVNSTSPDEVLNSKRALDELDKYALLEGSGKGYTAAYVRQAYGNQLGQVEGRSEPSVRSQVQRINYLMDTGDIRSAYGLSAKLKEQIDKGEKRASDEDYDLIGRIVAFYE